MSRKCLWKEMGFCFSVAGECRLSAGKLFQIHWLTTRKARLVTVCDRLTISDGRHYQTACAGSAKRSTSVTWLSGSRYCGTSTCATVLLHDDLELKSLQHVQPVETDDASVMWSDLWRWYVSHTATFSTNWIINGDGGYGLLADSAYIGGLAAQAGWLGPKVGGHLAPLLYSLHEPSELSQWLCSYDDSTINIVIIIIIIIIYMHVLYVRMYVAGTTVVPSVHCWCTILPSIWHTRT